MNQTKTKPDAMLTQVFLIRVPAGFNMTLAAEAKAKGLTKSALARQKLGATNPKQEIKSN